MWLLQHQRIIRIERDLQNHQDHQHHPKGHIQIPSTPPVTPPPPWAAHPKARPLFRGKHPVMSNLHLCDLPAPLWRAQLRSVVASRSHPGQVCQTKAGFPFKVCQDFPPCPKQPLANKANALRAKSVQIIGEFSPVQKEEDCFLPSSTHSKPSTKSLLFCLPKKTPLAFHFD